MIKTLIPLSALGLLLGCSNPAKDVPSASVEKKSDSATNAATAPEPEGSYFAFGPTSSAIAFTGSKVTRSHNGGFRNFGGEFKVVNGKVAKTGNKVVIDTSSLYADDPRLTSHLKSRDFFGVSQFPTSTFTSTSIEDTGTNSTVTGDLTLHGVTKSISFPAKITVNNETVNVASVFSIHRSDFGIKYPGMANDLIREEVILRLNVKAAPGRADFTTLEQAAQTGAAAVQTTPPPGGRPPPPGGQGPGPGAPPQ